MNDDISLLRAEIADLKRHVLELKELVQPRTMVFPTFTITAADLPNYSETVKVQAVTMPPHKLERRSS
jgi:hypothetical protein